MKVRVFGKDLLLLPEKALFIEDEHTLVIADLHLGKVNHFRKAGIPVPSKANEKNWDTLIRLIQHSDLRRVVFLGDLFHSHYNDEWEAVGQLVRSFQSVSFELVIGNHDILSKVQYERSQILVHQEPLQISSFVLTHHPMEDSIEGKYNLSGHIHPGVQLSGKGKQAVTLPCFYFGEHHGILPAFGTFTGLARIHPKKNDQLYVIANDAVLKI